MHVKRGLRFLAIPYAIPSPSAPSFHGLFHLNLNIFKKMVIICGRSPVF
jgi:hypothetical protein